MFIWVMFVVNRNRATMPLAANRSSKRTRFACRMAMRSDSNMAKGPFAAGGWGAIVLPKLINCPAKRAIGSHV